MSVTSDRRTAITNTNVQTFPSIHQIYLDSPVGETFTRPPKVADVHEKEKETVEVKVAP